MGNVVQLSAYRHQSSRETPAFATQPAEGLLPIEFAVGFCDRERCLKKVAQYGVPAIHVRAVHARPDALLYFIGRKEAIWLNKKILEVEEIDDEEVTRRIDLIQMMENMDLTLLDSLWASFTRRDNQSKA